MQPRSQITVQGAVGVYWAAKKGTDDHHWVVVPNVYGEPEIRVVPGRFIEQYRSNGGGK